MDNSTYYQKNRDIILKRAKYYYCNNIEAIRNNMRDKYKNLLEEEKEKIKIYEKNIEKRLKTIFQKKKKRK